jgi:hypothetical protein
MYKEINIGNNNSLVLFHQENFWEKIIPDCFSKSDSIDVITCNFNFINKEEQSFYKKLRDLANKGVNIRLLYAKMTDAPSDKPEIEEIFKNFVLCAELPQNNSKMFLSNEVAFIGSANFSLESNKNYESGVIIRDTNTIKNIRRDFVGTLLDLSEFTNIPGIGNDPDYFISSLKKDVDNICSFMNDRSNLYIDKNREVIPQLRYWDYVKATAIKVGVKFEHEFDWEEFYYKLYKGITIEDNDYVAFKDYIIEFKQVLKELSNVLIKSYEENGRLITLESLGEKDKN